ncbi:S-receptor-like serine/threonine-protein kinase protein [Dioscorea alata]|uniref:S-receptor-like serine/threonine-protein kinase protein n=1 Tax=Dioscorea alata TaxID=55571 RepID=A0ACB7UNF7_DIOAL|nr:S-receptor-like serine/threonine-protein kinase protein [Dioscorea alata]
MKTSTIISITTFFLYYLFHPCYTTDTLSPTQPLSENQTLVSASGTFTLGFFTPTNISNNRYVGIWYHNLPIQTIVWVANRQHPIPQSSTGVLTLTTNGTLIITSIQHNSTTILWSSTPTTINLNNPVAQLLDNGNFVVKNQLTNDVVAWQSFDHPTDTLLPGMKLGLDFTTGLNHNLTSWKSSGDPSPGDYSVAMDIRGDPQLVVSDRSVRKWRSGPWTGFSFDSIPEMAAYTRNGFSFDFVNNSTGIYYSYEVSNRSIITRLVVNQTGKTERYVWLGQSGWSVFWYTPRTQCSGLDSCGPNGVCGLFSSPMCRCLKGFKPRSPRDWDLLDGSDGCVRKEPLDCRNGTDGFWKMTAAQLPDTWSSFVDRSLGLDECKAKCLMNCSCTAYANADVRAGGSGCILWFGDFTGLGAFQSGQDLYVRLAASEFASSGKKSVDGAVIVIVVVIAVLLLLTALACTAYCVCRKRKRRGNATGIDHHNHENEMKDEEVELPIFDLSVILEATDNFAPENKLGQGGFGPVYKGKLEDGLEIAVKRLSKDSLQGIQEFKNEVKLITKLQHRNLVRLLGCCLQVEDRMLIYEYMPNKSLDAFLFDKEKSASLDWQTRYQIILGVARGLLYLHQESRVTIIHRDLKAGNILLDETMNPKISDFGMARIFGGDDSATKTRKVVGTYGYMAPEYAMDGVFSVKSDVYSYGVLVLEIISGQKNRGVYLSNPDLCLLGKVSVI